MAQTVVFLDTCTTSSSWESLEQQHTQQQLHSWPTALLPRALPGTQVIVLPCQLGPAELRSSKQRGSTVAAALVKVGLRCEQLVLVGHGFGGHLVKEACLQLQQLASSSTLPACQRQQYACTLASIRGLVFYSTPHTPLPRLALPQYEYVLPDMADACQQFRTLAARQGWQTLGVGAAVQGDPGCSVPLSAAAKGMSSFVAVAADQQGVCRPTSASHPSFLALQRFLQQLMHHQGPQDVAAAALLAAAKDLAAELEGATATSSSPPPVRLFSLLQRRVAAVQG